MSQHFNFEYRETDNLLYPQAAESEWELMMQDREGDSLLREDNELSELLWAVVEEHLTEREQWILRASVDERLGVRVIGEQLNLSKSQVHRVLQAALAKLRDVLSTSPVVCRHLGMAPPPALSEDNATLDSSEVAGDEAPSEAIDTEDTLA